MLLLIHRLGIDRRNVRAARMSVAITRKLVRAVGTVGETGVAAGRLRGMTRESTRGRSVGAVLTVH